MYIAYWKPDLICRVELIKEKKARKCQEFRAAQEDEKSAFFCFCCERDVLISPLIYNCRVPGWKLYGLVYKTTTAARWQLLLRVNGLLLNARWNNANLLMFYRCAEIWNYYCSRPRCCGCAVYLAANNAHVVHKIYADYWRNNVMHTKALLISFTFVIIM